MISTLAERIITLAASPNASFAPSEADQWLEEALESLDNRESVLGEMRKSLEITAPTTDQLPTPPSKWQAVKLDANQPQKRKIIIKRRK